MSWHKVWLVLRREYLFNFKRPSFLFTAFGVPLISVVAMVLIFQFTANRETNLDKFQRVGYVDRAGVVTARANNPDNYQPVRDPALAAPAESAPDAERVTYFDALETAAHQQLLDGDLDAYFVIPEHYILSGQVGLYSQKNVPQALLDGVEDFLRDQIGNLAPAGLPVGMERLVNPATITMRDVDSGDELTETAMVGRFLLPFLFVFVYFMAANTTAQFLMSGVVDEKENRLMEILATSLRPIELLWG
ncbi:MAG: ABC transporter permease, partial [Anaerolineae bacterium]|nr:ABC transporter permease [Anaerolineae bacterium]